MIIIDKATELTFGDLECGDVFKKYKEDEYLMKTERCIATEDKASCNFITLKDGIFGGYMCDDEYVVKVSCSLIVE